MGWGLCRDSKRSFPFTQAHSRCPGLQTLYLNGFTSAAVLFPAPTSLAGCSENLSRHPSGKAEADPGAFPLRWHRNW